MLSGWRPTFRMPSGRATLAEFFRRAQGESPKGAEQAKQMLTRRLSS
jgi:hypothetical protein